MKLKELFEDNSLLSKETLSEISKVTQGTVRLSTSNELFCDGNFNINTDYVRDLFIERIGSVRRLKYKFILVNGEFNVGSYGLTTFENFPDKINSNSDMWGNNFSNFDGITPIINGLLDIQLCNNLTSFKDINKYLKSCKQIIVPGKLESNILGLLRIEKLREIATSFNEVSSDQIPELSKAVKIINKHLRSGKRLSKCKEELIEAGLKEFAKL